MLGVIDPTKEGKEFLAPAEQTLLATKGAPGPGFPSQKLLVPLAEEGLGMRSSWVRPEVSPLEVLYRGHVQQEEVR